MFTLSALVAAKSRVFIIVLFYFNTLYFLYWYLQHFEGFVLLWVDGEGAEK